MVRSVAQSDPDDLQAQGFTFDPPDCTQALSNLTFAYDKTNLLDRELLQWIFCVAAFRLDFMELTGTSHFGFKPQVTCCSHSAVQTSSLSVTLLSDLHLLRLHRILHTPSPVMPIHRHG